MRPCSDIIHGAVSDPSKVGVLCKAVTIHWSRVHPPVSVQKVPDTFFFRVAKSVVLCILSLHFCLTDSSTGFRCDLPFYRRPRPLIVWCRLNRCLTIFCFTSLRWPYSHAKQKEQYLGFFCPPSTGASWHATLQNTLGSTHSHTHTLSLNRHTHRQETSEYLLWCPHTPPTPSSHSTLFSPGPVLPTLPNLLLLLSAHRLPLLPSPPPPPPLSTMSPVGGVTSGLCGGLLTTGPDNQCVCKCRCVIFKSLFMVRVLKEDIFMVIVAGLFYYIFM